jgi:hypothetical protein
MSSKKNLAGVVMMVSLSLVSSLVLAGSTVRRPFACSTPWFGSERCGSDDTQLRIGGKCTVEVLLTRSEGDTSMNFHLKHAVSGDALTVPTLVKPTRTEGIREKCKQEGQSEEACKVEEDKSATLLWTNPKDSAVDVYLNAASVGSSLRKQIEGRVIVKCP